MSANPKRDDIPPEIERFLSPPKPRVIMLPKNSGSNKKKQKRKPNFGVRISTPTKPMGEVKKLSPLEK